MKIPYSDFKHVISEHFDVKYQANWNEETSNKLYKIQQRLKKLTNSELNRRDNVKYTRLKIGHTHLTHSFLVKEENPPLYVLDAIKTSPSNTSSLNV